MQDYAYSLVASAKKRTNFLNRVFNSTYPKTFWDHFSPAYTIQRNKFFNDWLDMVLAFGKFDAYVPSTHKLYNHINNVNDVLGGNFNDLKQASINKYATEVFGWAESTFIRKAFVNNFFPEEGWERLLLEMLLNEKLKNQSKEKLFLLLCLNIAPEECVEIVDAPDSYIYQILEGFPHD